MEACIFNKIRSLYNSSNKNALDKYISLIDDALADLRMKRDKDSDDYVYLEEHHILPRSLYPDLKDDKNNKVLLTASEHFIVHKLLCEIIPCKEMYYAFWRMCCCNGKKCIVSPEDFEYARKLNAENPPYLGHSQSDETREKLRIKSLQFWERGGYEHSKEQDIKMVNTRRANGSYMVTSEHRKKISESMKGRIFINNGERNKSIYECELDEYLKDGWVRGKKPLSEEHKRNISKSGKGKHTGPTGRPGTFLGRKHTEESKRKMSETKRLNREKKTNQF